MPHDRVADFAHGNLERIAQRGIDVAHAQRHGEIVNTLDGEMHIPFQGSLCPQKGLGLRDDRGQIRKPLRQRRGREARHAFACRRLLGALGRSNHGLRIGLGKTARVFDQNQTAAAVATDSARVRSYASPSGKSDQISGSGRGSLDMHFTGLEPDDLSSNRHPAPAFFLNTARRRIRPRRAA
jgi:hypothetical protein